MPANDTVYQREYMRMYRAAGKDTGSKRKSVARTREFVGCDGEGATLDSGYHAYFMLRIGNRVLRARGGNARLTTTECLDFICSLPPDKIYIGYYFDYDVTKILEDLPFTKMKRLVHRGMRMGLNGMLFPLDYLDYQIEYLPRKEFKVRKVIERNDEETKWSPWITISDVGSFFQTSFLAAIKSWKIGTAADWKRINTGKQGRATFDIRDFDEIDRYNKLEIRLLQELMNAFRNACIKTGYVPSRWQGPGLLAESMLRGNGVKKTSEIPLLNDENYSGLLRTALSAYYGGRTEVTSIGPIDRPVYQYDINSAYPYAMQFVPCLLHGKWRHYDRRSTDENTLRNTLSSMVAPTGTVGERFALGYGLYKAKANGKALLYGYPLRTSTGTIVYPETAQGWYWSFEINAAIHQIFEPYELWVYTRTCTCRPLAFVQEVYRERQAIGKDGPGIVLKLGMNSLYGKTVQSIGSPKYSNPIWGSFITAYPRMMIQEFIHSSPRCAAGKCGDDVHMIATDSVTTTTLREDYIVSKELGGWSLDIHPDGFFIVQPGVYFGTAVDDKGNRKRPKTRGVPLNFIEQYEDVFRQRFLELIATGDLNVGSVRVPQKIFVGLRYAVHRHNTKLAGQWIEFGEGDSKGKQISFDWTTKRAAFPALAPSASHSWIQTFPYVGNADIVTTPYSKDIGGLQDREEQRLAFADQPDWSVSGEWEE